MLGNSPVAAQLAASQEGFSFKELVSVATRPLLGYGCSLRFESVKGFWLNFKSPSDDSSFPFWFCFNPYTFFVEWVKMSF
jgi:hypothetical protein